MSLDQDLPQPNGPDTCIGFQEMTTLKFSLFPPDTLFTAFIATVEKIITYALGEHDPGSAQDGRTTSAALPLPR